MKTLFYVAVVLFAALLCADAYGALLELKVKYWMPKLDGDVRADDDGITGTTINIEEDLGIETDDENVMPVELVLHLGRRLRLWLGYRDMEFEGSASVNDEFVFAGDTFLVKTDIDSRLELTSTEIGIELDLIPTEMFGIGACVSAAYFDGQATITDTNFLITATGTFSSIVPSFGVFAKLNLYEDKLTVYGRFSGLTYEDDTYTDFLLEGKFELLANVGIICGYRSVSVDIEQDEVFVDADMSGFFIGGVISF